MVSKGGKAAWRSEAQRQSQQQFHPLETCTSFGRQYTAGLDISEVLFVIAQEKISSNNSKLDTYFGMNT
jgi:hypothetical protein